MKLSVFIYYFFLSKSYAYFFYFLKPITGSFFGILSLALFICLMGLISHRPCRVVGVLGASVLPIRKQVLSCPGPEKPRVQPPTADEKTEVRSVKYSQSSFGLS